MREKKIHNIVSAVFACYLCVASTFLLRHNIYELLCPQYYIISIIIPVLLIIPLFLVQREITVKLNCVDILLGFLLMWVVIQSIINGVSVDNIFKVITLGILYILTKCIYDRFGRFEIIILPFLIISGIESILFLWDYIAGCHEGMMPGGTLGNSARLSGILLIVTPICILSFSKSSNKLFRTIYAIIFILNNAVIILAFSRAAIMGLLFAYAYLAYKNKYIKLSLKTNVLFAGVFILISILFLVLKYDSAIGRLLIWKIAISKLYPYFLFGNGIDSFIPLYNNAQAEYFADKFGIFDKESSVAGFVAYPYNEMLNTLIELGLIPFLILTVLLYMAFKSDESDKVMVYIKSSILAVLIFSMFSYTSKIYPMLIILVIYLAALKFNTIIAIKLNTVVRILCSGLLLGIVIFQFFSLMKYEAWIQIKEQYLYAGTKPVRTSEYSKLIKRFNGSYMFMADYAGIQYDMGEDEKCIEILQEVTDRFPDPNLLVLQAKSYMRLKEDEKAERLLIKAANIIPSKFEPKYWLFKLYERTDTEKAMAIANIISNQPIKVTSNYVLKVQQEVNDFIKFKSK